MSAQSIIPHVVREALGQLGDTFRTKELSRHPTMLQGHAGLASHSHYHAFVGKYLSERCDDVERIGDSSNDDGALWRNKLSGVAASVRAGNTPDDASFELGPQCRSDDAFTARMRRHQSWYRANVLGVTYGTGPTAESQREYGNMLTRADAERGLNFLTPEIHRVALSRLRERNGKVEPYRLMHNMLSSQPMCFNLFGPLVDDLELATRLVQALPGLDAARVLAVKLEFAPEPRGEYLADGTSFDAFIDYERRDHTRAFLGIETKLTDTFSPIAYDSPDYRRWMSIERSPWNAEAAGPVSEISHNQLWRDHLLAVALREHAASPYQHGALMLVRHPEDQACIPVVRRYQRLLKDADDTLIDMPLDRLIALWKAVTVDAQQRAWLEAFARRYLDLEASPG